MNAEIQLPIILMAAFIGAASPGPATLGIAGVSMASGRGPGVAMALGVVTGSLMWSFSAALGLGAIMLANAWMFEVIRYIGVCYLMYLAYNSAKAAVSNSETAIPALANKTLSGAYRRGLFLHLTNPKAILFFGSLYSIGVPPGTPLSGVMVVFLSVGALSATIFVGYGVLFSSAAFARAYSRLHRLFNSVFALAFGSAGVKILFTRFA